MKFKSLFVLLIIVCVVSAQDSSLARRRKKYYGIPAFFYKGGILAFIAFVAIKAKILIAITVAVTVMTFGMKAFAFLKYGKNFLPCHHEEIEYSHPGPSFAHDFSSSGPIEYSSYPGPPEDTYGPPKTPHVDSAYEKYGRSKGDEFEKDWGDSLKKIMKRVDLTEFAFDAMDMKDEVCRQKFVCEMDHISKRNSLLGFGLMFFSDQGLNKYRNNTIDTKTVKECTTVYADCTS